MENANGRFGSARRMSLLSNSFQDSATSAVAIPAAAPFHTSGIFGSRMILAMAGVLSCAFCLHAFAQDAGSDGASDGSAAGQAGEVNSQVGGPTTVDMPGRVSGAIPGAGAVGHSPVTGGFGETEGGDVFTAWLGDTVSYDSNLFRLSDSLNPQSDTINTTSLSLRIDKQISLQRFQLEISEVVNRYSDHSALNYNATNYNGSWTWTPSRRWTIGVNASRTKSQAPFEDTVTGITQRNVATTTTEGVTANGWITGGWYLVAGASHSDFKSEQGVIDMPDQRTNDANYGLRYLSPLGNSVTLMRRNSNGDYMGFATTTNGSTFKETETTLQAVWNVTAKSQLQGQVGHLERTNDQIGVRDFSGPSASVGYLWRPTSALSFNWSASRRSAPLIDPFFSYSRETVYAFSPAWRITEKVSTHMTLARATSKYAGSGLGGVGGGFFGFGSSGGIAIDSTTNSAEIGLDWLALQNFTVNTSLLHTSRSSNVQFFQYNDNLASVGVQWRFW